MKGKGRKKKTESRDDLKNVLLKKALGYDTTEVVEEYVGDDDGEVRLTKKKVTTKYVPPDTTCLKLLLDETEQNLCELTDEELVKEKNRLLKLLSQCENEKGEKN